MNIQIFGSSKSFDSKKAERWFKERARARVGKPRRHCNCTDTGLYRTGKRSAHEYAFYPIRKLALARPQRADERAACRKNTFSHKALLEVILR